MYTILLISLFFIPMFYAESYQTELDNNQEMVIPRSVAASYLCKYNQKMYLFYFLFSWSTTNTTISRSIIKFTN